MTPDDDNATQRGLDDSDDDGEDDSEHAQFEAEEDMGEQVESEERVSNAGSKLPNLASIERDWKINKKPPVGKRGRASQSRVSAEIKVRPCPCPPALGTCPCHLVCV